MSLHSDLTAQFRGVVSKKYATPEEAIEGLVDGAFEVLEEWQKTKLPLWKMADKDIAMEIAKLRYGSTLTIECPKCGEVGRLGFRSRTVVCSNATGSSSDPLYCNWNEAILKDTPFFHTIMPLHKSMKILSILNIERENFKSYSDVSRQAGMHIGGGNNALIKKLLPAIISGELDWLIKRVDGDRKR